MSFDVGIIGGGWSGLAAAVELALSGHRVTVYESGKTLGGRARSIDTSDGVLDNGLHLMIGAYTECLRLMECVAPGSSHSGFLRLPLTLDYPEGVSIKAPRLPAPFHLAAALLFAKGLSWRDRFDAIRFIQHLKRIDFQPDASLTVAEAIAGQADGVRRYLWEPLCVAALNTPIEQSSFRVFARVLHDSLMGKADNSNLLIPARDLGSLFPLPAQAWLERNGHAVLSQCRVESISPDLQLSHSKGTVRHEKLILATSPHQAARLLAPLPDCAAIVRDMERLSYQPIVTVYVEYGEALSFATPLLGWVDPVPLFLFDLQASHGRRGWLAAVASADGPHLLWDDSRWQHEIHARVLQATGKSISPPRIVKRITEKRATFTCSPSMSRPACKTPVKGLYLSGDYVDGPYPSTLEGAVRSGVQCAQTLLSES